MQMVAALRGQFGGHPVMTLKEGEDLRRKGIAGDWDIAPAAAKAAVRKSVTKGAAKKTTASESRHQEGGRQEDGEEDRRQVLMCTSGT